MGHILGDSVGGIAGLYVQTGHPHLSPGHGCITNCSEAKPGDAEFPHQSRTKPEPKAGSPAISGFKPDSRPVFTGGFCPVHPGRPGYGFPAKRPGRINLWRKTDTRVPHSRAATSTFRPGRISSEKAESLSAPPTKPATGPLIALPFLFKM